MFRTLTFILLIAFTVQCFHVSGIVFGYYMNTAAYARNCVNKAKPVLKCNGKCQMSKKILEQQEKESQSSRTSTKTTWQLLAFSSFFVTVESAHSVAVTTYNDVHNDAIIPSNAVDSIFHPPSLV